MTQKMSYITISKDVFNTFKKEMLREYIKDNCDFCGEKITKDNFGLLTRDVTCCNSTFCLVIAINKKII